MLGGCGVLRTRAGEPLPERLLRLHTDLLGLIDRWRPREAAVEDLFHALNARAALVLGHARGVLVLGLRQRGLDLHSYAPRMIKKAVTGSGAASKDQVRRWVCRWLRAPADHLDTNASDALAVALCHAGTAGWRRAEGALRQHPSDRPR